MKKAVSNTGLCVALLMSLVWCGVFYITRNKKDYRFHRDFIDWSIQQMRLGDDSTEAHS